MKKIAKLLTFFAIWSILTTLTASEVKAQCSIQLERPPHEIKIGDKAKIIIKNINQDQRYALVHNEGRDCHVVGDGNGSFSMEILFRKRENNFQIYPVTNWKIDPRCRFDKNDLQCQATFIIGGQTGCDLSITPPNPQPNDEIIFHITNLPPSPKGYFVRIEPVGKEICRGADELANLNMGKFGKGKYRVNVDYRATGFPHFECSSSHMRICSRNFEVGGEKPGISPKVPEEEAPYKIQELCRGNPECINCMTPSKEGGKGGFWTALGCISVESPSDFVAWFLKFALGIGGGIAFLLMLFGVFQIITSGGNPEKLQAGKELITSALAGLLMIIFSVFLLELIGVKILAIPGF